MTLLKIARLGHPVLLGRAEPVGSPTGPAMRRLITDMIETMLDAQGVGLAAPQVHEGRRVIVVLPSGDRANGQPLALIDPELRPLDDEVEEGFEGCLSIPGLRGVVPRQRRLAWQATDSEGEPITGMAEGFFARVLQHEVDHLDGILYPMRMPDLRQLAFDSELARLQAWRAQMTETRR